MKIFITADYEGVCGHVQWGRGGEREAITADINAAIAPHGGDRYVNDRPDSCE